MPAQLLSWTLRQSHLQYHLALRLIGSGLAPIPGVSQSVANMLYGRIRPRGDIMLPLALEAKHVLFGASIIVLWHR